MCQRKPFDDQAMTRLSNFTSTPVPEPTLPMALHSNDSHKIRSNSSRALAVPIAPKSSPQTASMNSATECQHARDIVHNAIKPAASNNESHLVCP